MGVDLDRRYEHVSAEVPFAPVGSVFGFFGGGGRAAVLDAITLALGNDDACILVQGEPGSGKTTLSSVLGERCKATHNIIRYERDELSVAHVLHQLVVELCPRQVSAPDGKADSGSVDVRQIDAYKDAVISRLELKTPGGRPVLLLLDSRTRMRPPVRRLLDELTSVRRLGNRMFQVVVFEQVDTWSRHTGQHAPEATRAVNHHRLRRLTLAEIGEYLHHNMLLFDFNRRHVFNREMAYFIADRSQGVFRSINTIARNAFTIARLEGLDRPSMSHLLLAGLPPAEDEPTPGPKFIVRNRKAVIALLGSSVVASAAALVLLALRQ